MNKYAGLALGPWALATGTGGPEGPGAGGAEGAVAIFQKVMMQKWIDATITFGYLKSLHQIPPPENTARVARVTQFCNPR